MAFYLGVGLSALLAVTALLHFVWALGLSFPYSNRQRLAQAIIGRRGITDIPSPLATGFIGLLLAAAAVAAWLLASPDNLSRGAKYVLTPVGLFIGGCFLVRALVGILPAYERAAPEQPFLSLNRRVYTPASALVALGFLYLAITLPSWSWRISLPWN